MKIAQEQTPPFGLKRGWLLGIFSSFKLELRLGAGWFVATEAATSAKEDCSLAGSGVHREPLYQQAALEGSLFYADAYLPHVNVRLKAHPWPLIVHAASCRPRHWWAGGTFQTGIEGLITLPNESLGFGV